MTTSPRTSRHFLSVFLLTAFPVHVYSYYNSFREFPAWLARLNTGDLITTVALTQLFTLLETLIVFVPLALFLYLLPKPREVYATLLLAISACWAIGAHLYIESLRDWAFTQYALAGGVYLLMVVAVVVVGMKIKRVRRAVVAINERLVVLSGLYITLDLIGVVVIVIGFLR